MSAMITNTPRTNKVLALAQKEAKKLNHSYLGTEHLLLAILEEGNGSAARFLLSMDSQIGKKFLEYLTVDDRTALQVLKDRVAELEAKIDTLQGNKEG